LLSASLNGLLALFWPINSSSSFIIQLTSVTMHTEYSGTCYLPISWIIQCF